MRMDTDAFLVLLVLALAIGSTAMITAKTYIFQSLRKRIAARSMWFGKLVGCPLCTSVWLWIAAVLVFQPLIFAGLPGYLVPYGYVVTVFAGVALSTMVIGLMTKSITVGAPAPAEIPQKPASRPARVAPAQTPAEALKKVNEPSKPETTLVAPWCPGTSAKEGKHKDCSTVSPHYSHRLGESIALMPSPKAPTHRSPRPSDQVEYTPTGPKYRPITEVQLPDFQTGEADLK